MRYTVISKMVFAALIFSSSNVAAYSQQTLQGDVYADVKIVNASVKMRSRSQILDSPKFINHLRNIFSSNHIKKPIHQ